jgi:hypothetical protein
VKTESSRVALSADCEKCTRHLAQSAANLYLQQHYLASMNAKAVLDRFLCAQPDRKVLSPSRIEQVQLLFGYAVYQRPMRALDPNENERNPSSSVSVTGKRSRIKPATGAW